MNDKHKSPEVSFITKIIATGAFSGYMPWASGTFGSIVGLLIYFIPGVEEPAILMFLILIGFFAGVRTSAIVARAVGNKLSKSAELAKEKFQPGKHDVPDPSIVVIDEIVGMWISLLLLPKSFLISTLAFFFFRIFDIIKPPPARQFERYPNGWGIMLDDVMAGVYANLAVRVFIIILPGIFHA